MADFWKDIAPNIGGFIGTIGNLFGIGSSNAQNAENIERQNQLNLEQWMRENNYNLPINQVQRLREAGLSPSLMYENGVSGLVAAASPEMQAAHANPLQVDPLALAQVEKLQAETESIQDANTRENEKQPLTLDNLQASLDSIYQSIDESSSRMSLNVELSRQAYTQALKNFEDFQYLRDTLEFRVHSAFNDMTLGDIEVDKNKTEYRYLEDTLKQMLDNLRATYTLITEHANYYRESANVQFSNSVSSRVQAMAAYGNMLGKINEIEGQLDRWDNQTINERLDLLRDGIDLGNEIYNGTSVNEKVKTESGGGKPPKTTRTYSRRRRPKLKPFKNAKPPIKVQL